MLDTRESIERQLLELDAKLQNKGKLQKQQPFFQDFYPSKSEEKIQPRTLLPQSFSYQRPFPENQQFVQNQTPHVNHAANTLLQTTKRQFSELNQDFLNAKKDLEQFKVREAIQKEWLLLIIESQSELIKVLAANNNNNKAIDCSREIQSTSVLELQDRKENDDHFNEASVSSLSAKSIEDMLSGLSEFEEISTNKAQSGRPTIPAEEFIRTRFKKLKHLKLLSLNQSLTANSRKKFRSQRYALKRRIEAKIEALKAKKAEIKQIQTV